MKRLLLALALAPALGSAQVQFSGSFSFDLPIVVPRLVVVAPGIQVVPDVDAEIFFADGYYWTLRPDGWYRSGNPRHGWKHRKHGVPQGLHRIPPGQYRRYRPAPPPPRAVYRGDGRHDDHGRDHGGHDDGKHKGKGKGKH